MSDDVMDRGPAPATSTVPRPPEPLDTRHARERRLLEEAQRDVCRSFPWLSAERVNVLVECLWSQFDDAHVRDFIPVLVRKQAREELRDELHADLYGRVPT
jgi:hypothetical protein